MSSITRIDPPASDLATTIADGLYSDLGAGRISALGRIQIEDAIEARDLRLEDYEREQLIALVCRKVVAKVS